MFKPGCESMLSVTGRAGFIGSNLMAALNDAGPSDVVVNDTLGAPLADAVRRCIIAFLDRPDRYP
jgi:nucleoside-diphosphate-sugar epimerase